MLRIIAATLVIGLLVGLPIPGCTPSEPHQGPTIVRICADGTYIVRQPNGKLTTLNGYRPVEGIEVCDVVQQPAK